MQDTIYFLSPPAILHPGEKIRWVSIFFEKLIRYYQEEHNL